MITIVKRVGRTLKQIPDRLKYPKPSPTFYRLGSEYGGWWIETVGLDENSRIVSAGIGEDITFDLALVERFGCHILALDPTPKAVAYVERVKPGSNFRFQACGLAEKDGNISLVPPKNPNYASYSLTQNPMFSQIVSFPAKSLKTVLAETGWTAFDLVKMDIEGSEYGVIDSIIRNQVSIKQLCIEFHDKIAAGMGRTTAASVKQLEEYGLKLIFKENHNFTFWNT
ncbi:MAG: FkbM family methyltransferase [Anaerolineae bacterium]|nr:FkbM family methyltransferase [Anaerolineae bacterium]